MRFSFATSSRSLADSLPIAVIDKKSLRRRHFKTQQLAVILDLCLRKTRTEKSNDFRDYIVLEKLRFREGRLTGVFEFSRRNEADPGICNVY